MIALTPSDGMALTMVAILGLTLGTILTMFWAGARNARRRPDIEQGLEDEEDGPAYRDPKPTKAAKDEQPQPQPWERDGDWWK